jgi:hypothetical protein
MSNSFSASCRTEQQPKKAKRLQPAYDAEEVQQKWLTQFEGLKDARGMKGKEHAFLSIVMIAILATIGGARGWEDIELTICRKPRDMVRKLFRFKQWDSTCRHLQTSV